MSWAACSSVHWQDEELDAVWFNFDCTLRPHCKGEVGLTALRLSTLSIPGRTATNFTYMGHLTILSNDQVINFWVDPVNCVDMLTITFSLIFISSSHLTHKIFFKASYPVWLNQCSAWLSSSPILTSYKVLKKLAKQVDLTSLWCLIIYFFFIKSSEWSTAQISHWQCIAQVILL